MPKKKQQLQTTIRISADVWRALRGLAEDRALEVGGRPSASAVVSELIEKASRRRQGRKEAKNA